jgi:hypothetical protein
MKTCVVRKRLEPKTSTSNYNFDIQTPTGFGVPKCGICFYTNGTDNDAFDESSLDRVFGIGFFGYSYANPATFTAYTSGIGFTHDQTATSTLRKAVSGSNVANRIAYEFRTDRSVIRQCNFISIAQDKITVNLVWTNPATSYLDLIFIIFSGDDIQANVGLLNVGTTINSTASATGLSYSPDLVFTMGAGFGFSNADADARLSFGCSTKYGGIKNSASFYRMRSNASGVAGIVTSVEQYISDNRCFIMYGGNLGVNTLQTADITSFNSDGFTMTSKTAFSTLTTGVMYLAIKGPVEDVFQLQNFSSSTSTGISAIATTTWIPSLIIGSIGCSTSVNSLVSSNDSTGMTNFVAKSLSSKNNYGTGTISVSSGSTSVTGSGTGFSRFNVGDFILSSTNNQAGVISEVVNSTSLYLKENSPITLSSDNFSFRPYEQFSVTIGSSHLSGPTKIASSISTSSIKVIKFGIAAGISTVIKGEINNFDSYPGFKINYSTVDASARKGWFLAIKDTELRRRDSN